MFLDKFFLQLWQGIIENVNTWYSIRVLSFWVLFTRIHVFPQVRFILKSCGYSLAGLLY